MRTQLGILVRGLIGIFHSIFDKPIDISEIANSFAIGTTIEGREIDCYEVGKEKERKILYIASIHGNEVGTTKLALRIAKTFSDRFSFYVIPTLNPDGYAVAKKEPGFFSGGREGRFNANGVDLNRNFDTKNFSAKSTWSHGKNYNEKTEVYCGEHGNSEPETQALINFIQERDIRVVVTLHNVGNDVVGSSDHLGRTLSEKFSEATSFRLVSDDEWNKLGQTGTLKNWCEENNVSLVEIEGSYRWGCDLRQQRSGHEAMLHHMLNATA